MLINLTKSKLFTLSPEVRFSKEYGLQPEVWRELWKRHSFHEYNLRDLCDYFELKTNGRKTSPQSMQRWLWRTYVYMKAQGVMKEGVEMVQSEFFGNFEVDVIRELLKNVKSSVRQEPKILI